jgi:hypothetical protein
MTTITALRSPWARLQDALDARRPVLVSYHGLQRLICPHALGHRAGREIVLGYQTGGDTTSGTLDPDPTRRWRCLYIDEITELAPAEPTSPWETAPNYNPANPFPIAAQVILAVPGAATYAT